GNKTVIELWVSTPQGPVLLDIEGERPTFFIDVSNAKNARALLISRGLKFELKSLPLKTFRNYNVVACYFVTIEDANTAITLLKQNDVVAYESDIRLADRYLMERFIKGSIEFTGHQL
nr:DNA polymerase II [Vibrio anguillarum]